VGGAGFGFLLFFAPRCSLVLGGGGGGVAGIA